MKNAPAVFAKTVGISYSTHQRTVNQPANERTMIRQMTDQRTTCRLIARREILRGVLSAVVLANTPFLMGAGEALPDWQLLLKEDPVKLLLKYPFYPENSIPPEALEQAAWKAVDILPSSILLLDDRCRQLETYPELLKKAAFESARRTPGATLGYLDRYENEDYCDDVILICADIYAVGTLRFMRDHAKKPWAKVVYLKIAEKYPNYVIKDKKYFAGEKWSAEVLAFAEKKSKEKLQIEESEAGVIDKG